MSEAPPNPNRDRMTIDEARQLYDMLRGGPPPGEISLGRHRPKLSARAAFGVIYVLQEHHRLIPDTFEQCCRCLEMYDSDYNGLYDDKTGRHYCDTCIPARIAT